MAESSTSAGNVGQSTKEEQLHMSQPAGDVEMDDLSQANPQPANPNANTTTSTKDEAAESRPIPVPDKDSPVAESSAKVQGKQPATDDDQDMTIESVGDGSLAVDIMLLLTTGSRHPFRIDDKYLTKRNVTVTGQTEDGRMDPFSITIYTLKELILRDWRREWDDPPREPSSIRLIHFGKLLEDRNQLNHYNFSRGTRNVVHMTIKPQDAIDEEEAAKKVKESGNHGGRSGCCVIL
ncbi:hypothetical protein F5Y15DRAFT_217212 [Xylariaceae sp. FL0016]|nr:hypothetical protein F5Y15DRAFT_217212 [Xylariaceae sp. FL0016]